MQIETFDDFNFSDELREGLDTMGYQKPTPVQQLVIPEILNNKDVIACAQTGTGKTAAYLLPVLQKIAELKIPHTSVLIVAPTRELAQQIDNAFQGLAYFTHASSIAIYGGNDGMSFEREKKALTEGCSVVIATPGRLLSHLRLGYVKFNQLDTLILDEADKMLDMGFADDILEITRHIPAQRQNLLFSATMPSKIRTLARKMMKDPVEINIAISKPAEGISQEAFVVYDEQKTPLLIHLLKEKEITSTIIFASTKLSVKNLEKEMQRAGIACSSIHSDLTQEMRETVLLKFRNRNLPVLIATDILSRGIDIENIGLVVNYDVPADAEDYVHRVGRTARAETTGRAVTLIGPKDQARFHSIEELIEKDVPKLEVPSELGATPNWNPERKKTNNKNRFQKGKSRHFKKPSSQNRSHK